MATWVANSWQGGYVADLGPYIGPLPSASPIPANLPDTAGQIDYLIGVPDGGMASGFVDNTFIDHWRGWNGTPGDLADTYWSNQGNGLDITTPGLHLMVLWYDLTFDDPGDYAAPTVDPRALVPPSFVAGGAGSPVGDPAAGSWTDVYPAGTWRFGVGVDEGMTYVAGGATHPTDVTVAESDVVTAFIAATSGTFTRSGSQFAGFGLHTLQAGDWEAGGEILTSSLGDFVAGGYTQQQQTFSLPGSLPDTPDWDTIAQDPGFFVLPPELEGLIEGIDFWMKPGADYTDPYRYSDFPDSAATAFDSWEDISLTIDPIEGHVVGTAGQLYTSLNIQLMRVDRLVTTGEIVADGDGTVIDTVTPDTGVGITGPHTTTVSIPSTDTDVGLVLRVPKSTLGIPRSSSGATGDYVAWVARMASLGTAFADLDMSPFRLWKPGSLLAWHNFTGHWQTFTGGTLYIFTPGLGPVPMADGFPP